MSDARISATLRLECRPSKTGNLLLFPYTLENVGPGDVYAMHALPSADPATHEAQGNDTAAIVIASDNGDAIIGKFVAPFPTDRRIAVQVFPLARRLSVGAKLEGRIEIPLPLAETSPYFPDLTLRGYEMAEIKGVALTIGYWISGNDGLSVNPAITRRTFSSWKLGTRRAAPSAFLSGSRPLAFSCSGEPTPSPAR
jgi:hypothetical protein